MRKFCGIFIYWLCWQHVAALDAIFSARLCSASCLRYVSNATDGEAQSRINTILASGMNVERLTSFASGSPYTFVATTNATNTNGIVVYLPLIVQATLRQIQRPVPRKTGDVTAAARNNINQMYNGNMPRDIDVGHIIAFQNGGTRDLFNYVGQIAALNRGPYKIIENAINDHINHQGGIAVFTFVAKYSGTIPTEFVVKLKLLNAYGGLDSDLLDVKLINT